MNGVLPDGAVKTPAVCNRAVSKSPGGKEYLVDLLVSRSTGHLVIVELNVTVTNK